MIVARCSVKSQLQLLPVTVRVFGERADTKKAEDVGAFIAQLPCVPPIGTVINVASLGDVEWVGDEQPSDFCTHARKAGVQIGNGLKILRTSFQLDEAAVCVEVRVDAMFVVDETIG